MNFGKAENRPGHRYRPIYLHYQRHHWYDALYGNHRIAILEKRDSQNGKNEEKVMKY